ncbi:MAG: YdhR family protein [Alphaproteobacteria bacterium]
MITAIVQFDLPGPMSEKQAEAAFEQAAGQFQNVEGLVRKYFLLSEDGKTAGGVYLWTRADLARAAHKRFSAEIKERFGATARVTLFHTPVIVDNKLGKIEVGEAA